MSIKTQMQTVSSENDSQYVELHQNEMVGTGSGLCSHV